MLIKITPNNKGNPPGELADAELHFTTDELLINALDGIDGWLNEWQNKVQNPGAVQRIRDDLANCRERTESPLTGLKLIGFAIWECTGKGGHSYTPDSETPADSTGARLCKHCDHTEDTHPKSEGRIVSFPTRQYSINGKRRSFALLQPISDVNAQTRLRELILQAYAEYEDPAAAHPSPVESSADAAHAERVRL